MMRVSCLTVAIALTSSSVVQCFSPTIYHRLLSPADAAHTRRSNKLPMSLTVGDIGDESGPNQELFEGQQQMLQLLSPNPVAELTTGSFNDNEIINKAALVGTVVASLAYLASLNAGIWHGWSVEEIVTRLPVDAWEQYQQTLAAYPIATKACTSATVYTIGDIIAQRTTGTEVGDLDRMRTARSMIAGLIGHGPLSHYWYNICDGFFIDVLHWTAWWAFIPKIIVDQTLWSPIWNSTYILLLGLMKMNRLDTIWSDVKRSTIPLMVSGLKLWPAAHVFTYGFIPVEHRLLWVDTVEILWVTILATQAAENALVAVEEEDADAKTATFER